jgi:hypothetical protein
LLGVLEQDAGSAQQLGVAAAAAHGAVVARSIAAGIQYQQVAADAASQAYIATTVNVADSNWAL